MSHDSRPDESVGNKAQLSSLRYATYTDWPRLDGRVGVCVVALSLVHTEEIVKDFRLKIGKDHEVSSESD